MHEATCSEPSRCHSRTAGRMRMPLQTCVENSYRDVLPKSQLCSCTRSRDIAVERWHLVPCFQAPTGLEPSCDCERTRRPNDLKFELHIHENKADHVSKAGVARPSRSWDMLDWSDRFESVGFESTRQNGTYWWLNVNNLWTRANWWMPLDM